MNKKILINSLSKNGIKNFIWPIKRDFVEKVNHRVMTDFIKTFKRIRGTSRYITNNTKMVDT